MGVTATPAADPGFPIWGEAPTSDVGSFRKNWVPLAEGRHTRVNPLDPPLITFTMIINQVLVLFLTFLMLYFTTFMGAAHPRQALKNTNSLCLSLRNMACLVKVPGTWGQCSNALAVPPSPQQDPSLLF